MTTTQRRVKLSIVVLLIYSVLQIAGQLAFAQPAPSLTRVAIQRQLTGRLSVRQNKAIVVNDLRASTGAAILSGATLETKTDEFATVDLGPLGKLDIGQNTRVILSFDERGTVKAMVEVGCVKLTANKGTTGEVLTPKGSVGMTQAATGGVIEMCLQPGADSPTTGAGDVGAGTTEGTAGGGSRIWIAPVVIAGSLAAMTPLFFQDNPSPS
jgi:hypothetical protein